MSPTCEEPGASTFRLAVREASLADLPFLEHLERTSFSDKRQSSRESLRNSIRSSAQSVLILEKSEGRQPATRMGAAILFQYKRSLRVYSVAVDTAYRMMGLGEALMQHVVNFAVTHGYERITLEADMANTKLVEWYKRMGFEPARPLTDYYGPGEAALRMVLSLSGKGSGQDHMVIVVDDARQSQDWAPGIPFCSAKDYLSDTNYSKSSRFQVLNLCNSQKTHSMGYYVSLLASARNHLVVPSVMAMKDATSTMVAQSLLDEIREYVDRKLPANKGPNFELTVILGMTDNPRYCELAQKLFTLFSIPFFTIQLQWSGAWSPKKIKVLHLKQVLADSPDLLRDALTAYCARKRYTRPRLKNYKYDLAILTNKDELTPPSDAMALERFRKAAEKVGFHVEFITKADQRRMCEFDALFIRETTALDNHTYGMSRHAYTEGLVVVDDPWSIMLCSNKVYLQERLANAGVCQPKGWLLARKACDDKFLKSLPLPLVLKLPESSFSQGVYLVKTIDDLKEKLAVMFTKTDLVIGQEFLKSDYDWRIGLIDNTPLYACKYYMASNHWQIYNWASTGGEEFSGKSDAVPVNQVPPGILKAAVSASSLIGNGFYGVDLKEVGGKAYVIEVNDNPSVDAGVEDELLGNELYERIMRSLFNRIEAERQQVRYVY
ncbi:GNAT family N-acetyltransferase [Pseudodesulfovibrio portus]|uniref:GNAT family N-acetyltransferase n=1 Tax=Pseudodesulfovibrio portus TaxID=231439 RepID=UPI0022314B63|nr:GNAT family N-acetyltransferase [Pseudodesulfovibrio portus]